MIVTSNKQQVFNYLVKLANDKKEQRKRVGKVLMAGAIGTGIGSVINHFLKKLKKHPGIHKYRVPAMVALPFVAAAGAWAATEKKKEIQRQLFHGNSKRKQKKSQ